MDRVRVRVRDSGLWTRVGVVLVFKTSRYTFPTHAAHAHEHGHGTALHVAACKKTSAPGGDDVAN